MTILISGATGFIGSAITRHLLEAGHAVCALSRSTSKAMAKFAGYEAGRRALADGRLTFIEGDVTRPETLTRALETWAAVGDLDAVIQAAQFPGAPVEDPRRGLTYAAVDQNGTLNLLGAIAQVYGVPTAAPTLARFPKSAPVFFT